MSLPAYLLRFTGGTLMLFGTVGALAADPLGPFYFLLGGSLLSAGLPTD